VIVSGGIMVSCIVWCSEVGMTSSQGWSVAKLLSALMVTVTVAHSVTIDTSAASVGVSVQDVDVSVPYAALESTYVLLGA